MADAIDINLPRGAEDTKAQLAVLRAELAALDRLAGERERQQERALNIQTEELQRRLDLLNGEQARLQAERDRFVGREVFEQFRLEYRAAHEALEALVVAGEVRSREALDAYRREVEASMKVTAESLATYRGRERGAGQVIGFSAGAIGVLITISTFIIVLMNN